MADTVEARALADALNVRVKFLYDLARQGHLTIRDGRVEKDTADDLRWRLACAQASAGGDGWDAAPTTPTRSPSTTT